MVVASMTGRKHVISSFLAKAGSDLGSDSGRGFDVGCRAWRSGSQGNSAQPNHTPSASLRLSARGMGILRQGQEGVALGTVPAKVVGCSHTQNMNWGWGCMMWQRG